MRKGPNPRIVCACLGVTEGQVRDAVRTKGACSLERVAACTEAGTGCTACHAALRALIARESARRPSVPARG